MNTKQKVALLATTHLVIFVATTLFYCFAATGRSMVHSAESWTTPVKATATYSERITEDEKAINERMKTPEAQAVCRAYVAHAVLLDKAIELEKAKSINDSMRTQAVRDIEEKVSALTSSKFEALKSVKEEARILIGK